MFLFIKSNLALVSIALCVTMAMIFLSVFAGNDYYPFESNPAHVPLLTSMFIVNIITFIVLASQDAVVLLLTQSAQVRRADSKISMFRDYGRGLWSLMMNVLSVALYVHLYLTLPNHVYFASRMLANRIFYWVPSTTCLIVLINFEQLQLGRRSYKLQPILRNTLVANWMMLFFG
jgi:hypothetical protein